MKKPKFLSKLSAVLTPRPKKILKASARTARPAIDDYDSDEPTTKLSSAFIVVLILHVVAVGGIYAFNSIKASRRDREVSTPIVEPAVPTATQITGNDSEAAPASSIHRTIESTAPVSVMASTKSASARQYEIKSGDNITKIAFAFSITPAELMAANQLKEGSTLRLGQILVIPAAKAASKAASEPVKTATAKSSTVAPTKSTAGSYTVKKGDTLTSIARRFGVTTRELSNSNKITDPKKLQLGQVLKVPSKS